MYVCVPKDVVNILFTERISVSLYLRIESNILTSKPQPEKARR